MCCGEAGGGRGYGEGGDRYMSVLYIDEIE